MAKTYTPHFKEKTGSTSGAEPSYLLEITHAQLNGPIRLTNDSQNLRIGSPGPFLSLPNFLADGSTIGFDIEFTKATVVPQVGPTSVVFTRAGTTATRVNASGLVEVVAADTPRFDFNPITLACKGILVEEARTNFVLHSDCKTGVSYAFLSGGMTDNGIDGAAIAPDGSVGARKWTATSAVNTNRFGDTVSGTPGTTYAGSIWIKTADGATRSGVLLDVSDNSTLAITVTPQWQRFSTTGLQAALTYRFLDISSLPVGAYHVWGADIEAGLSSTSYIPTTTTVVTRNADVPSITSGVATWFNPLEGTFFVEFQGLPGASGNVGNSRIIGVDGSSSRAPLSYNSGPGPSVAVGSWDGTQVTSAVNNYTTGNIGRLASVFTASEGAVSFDGGAAVVGTTFRFGATTAIYLGHQAGTLHLNGHLRRFTYIPKRLADADIVELTRTSFTTYSKEYVALAFAVTLPDDVAKSLPRAELSLDNVGRELVQWLEGSNGGKGAQVRMMQVMRDTPDIIECEYTLDLLNVRQNMLVITGQLGYENLFNQPGLAATYTPDIVPGIF